MPSIQTTERLVNAVNAYLGEEFIPSLDSAVRKYAGKDEDVAKYHRPATINSGKTGDGEINFTLYGREFDEAWYSRLRLFGWRYLDANSNVSTVYGTKRTSFTNAEGDTKIERDIKREYFNVDDPAKTKLAIAALFGTWEVEPEFLTEHAQEIDTLRGQLFENWQSGISSIDAYFVKE